MAHTIRVLIVDADADDSANLREKLAGARNVCFVTQTAGTIAEAFRTLEEKRVDALLLDLTTPGSEGIATLREFQARAPETPILIISSQHDEAESLETV